MNVSTQQNVLEQCLTLKSQLEAIEAQLAIEKDTEILATLIADREQLVSKFNDEKVRLRVVSGLPVPTRVDTCSNEHDRTRENDLVLANKLLVEKLNEAKQKNDALTTELESARLSTTHMREGTIALLRNESVNLYNLPHAIVHAFNERIGAHRQEVADIKLDRDRSLAGVLELLRCGETDYEVSTDIWDAICEKHHTIENLEAAFRRLRNNYNDVLTHIGRGLSGSTYAVDGIPTGIQAAIKYKKDMLADYDRTRTALDNVTKERDELKQTCERIAPQSQEDRFEIKCTIDHMERRIDQVIKERDVVRVELNEAQCKLNDMERRVLEREQAYDNLHTGVIDMIWNEDPSDVPHDIEVAIHQQHQTISAIGTRLQGASQRCDTLADERDEARFKLDDAIRMRDQARAALESADTKCKHIMARCDVVESRMHEYAKMASDHEATLGTRNELICKLTEDLRNASNQLIATTRERDGMIADTATLTQRLSELERATVSLSERLTASNLNDTYLRQVNDRLANRITTANQDNATLTQRLSELEKTGAIYAERIATSIQDNALLRDATNRITARAAALDQQNTYLRECVDKAVKWMESHPYAASSAL